METTVLAYGKLNLSLDVLQKRPTGYHDLKMVMETVELHDRLDITVTQGRGIRATSNLPYLPADGRNIAVKAAAVFFRELGLPEQQVSIRLHKRIPVGAGMAGGSSNAAAVLRGLDALMGTTLPVERLQELGGLLGSDVPYCIAGGTVLAEGRGDVMTPLSPLPPCHIVIAKPKFSISTASLFARIDCGKIRHRPDTEGILGALETGQLGEVALRMYNVFEDVLDSRSKDVAQIKSTLLDCGALGASMTGTGPAVFGLFDDESLAKAAWERLKETYPETFLTRNRGIII